MTKRARPLPRPRFFSLRAKMLWYFGGLSAVVLIALQLLRVYGIPMLGIDGEYQEKQRGVLLNLNLIAEIKKDLVSQWLDERRANIKLLADDVDLMARLDDAGAREKVLRKLQLTRSLHPAYISLSVVDLQSGRVVASTEPKEVGAGLKRDFFFERAAAAGNREVIDTARSPVNGHLYLTVARQTRSDGGGRARGVVVARIDPDRILGALLNSGDDSLGGSGEIVLINQDLKILSSLRHRLADDTAARVMEFQDRSRSAVYSSGGSEGTLLDVDYRGVPVLAAYRHVRISSDLGWGLVVKRDRDEVLGPVRQSLDRALLLSVAGLALMLLMAGAAARRLSRPIRDLSQAAELVEGGDLSARAAVGAADEVGNLARTFNGMVARLQGWYAALEAEVRQRTEELTVANASLTAEIEQRQHAERGLLRLNRLYAVVSETNQTIIRVADVDSLFRSACRIAVEYGQLRSASVVLRTPEGGWTLAAWEGDIQEAVSDVPTADGPVESDPLLACWRDNRSQVLAPLKTVKAPPHWILQAAGAGLEAVACFPLTRAGVVIGVFVLFSEEVDAFDQDELALLEEMAANVSFAVDSIDRDRKRQAAEQQIRREYDKQRVVSGILRASLEPIGLRSQLVNALQLLVSAPPFDRPGMATLHLARREVMELALEAEYGVPESVRVGCGTVAYGACGCGEAALLRNVLFCSASCARHQTDSLPYAHYCVPILSGDDLLGVFAVYLDAGHVHRQDEEEFLQSMAHTLAGIIRHSRAEAELRKLSRAVEQSPSSVVITDSAGHIQYVNPKFSRVTGYRPNEVVGRKPSILKSGETTPEEYRLLWETITAGGEWNGILHNRRKNGELYWESASISPIKDVTGTITHFLAVKEDITLRKEVEETLKESEARMRGIASAAMDAIITMDSDGNITYWNPAAEQIFGYSSKEALGQYLHALIVPPAPRQAFEQAFPHFRKTGEGGIVRKIVEMTAVRKNGTEFPIELSVSPVRIKGEWHAVGIIRDITDRKRAEQSLQHSAFHDGLTDLPNRVLFLNRLGQAIQRTARSPQHLFAVLFLDLDRFKNVNDSLGHSVGDQLLIEVAHKLGRCVRPGDTVARIGGDEFAVLLEPVKDVSGATHVAERIHEALREPIAAGGNEIFTSASIGITVSSGGYSRAEEMLRDADTAMYRAKAHGKARYQVFDAHMHSSAVALLHLETELRRAIERDEFELYYQPIVCLRDGAVHGFEALVRWRHPRRGLVGPGEFIELAEETGLVMGIGRKVLYEACRQLQAWRDGSPGVPLYVSVNLSPKQFLQPDLLQQIDDAIAASGISPGDLCLEITEGAMLDNAEAVAATLLNLKERNIRLYIDDFGTGYSSLSYLHQLPFDTLKIDRSFVSNLGQDGDATGIVQTIIALAHNFGMDVIAEGVENANQAQRLRALNCETVQGFLYSRPLPAEEAGRLVGARFPVEVATAWADPAI